MWVHFLHRHVIETVVILEDRTPPPHTVHSMQHPGTLAGPERQTPCHSPVRQWIGAEETAACGGRDEGDLGEGLLGIRGAAGERHDM